MTQTLLERPAETDKMASRLSPGGSGLPPVRPPQEPLARTCSTEDELDWLENQGRSATDVVRTDAKVFAVLSAVTLGLISTVVWLLVA